GETQLSAPASRRRRLLLPAAIVAVAVVIAAVLVLLIPRHKGSITGASLASPGVSASISQATHPPPLGSVIQLDPATGKVLTTAQHAVRFTGGGNPRIAVGEGGVWAVNIEFLS